MDHRVAQAPIYPATVAVAYTERTQERDVNAILLSEAFGRCLQELGQYAQSGYMINADCYLNQRDSYVCSEEHHSLLKFFSEVTGRPPCRLVNPQALKDQLTEFLHSNVLNRLLSVQAALLIDAAVQQ